MCHIPPSPWHSLAPWCFPVKRVCAWRQCRRQGRRSNILASPLAKVQLMVWYLEKYQISEQHILFRKALVLVEYFTTQQQQLEWETKPVSHLIVIFPLLNVPRIDRKRLQQSVGGLKTICYFWQEFTLPLFAGMFSWTWIGLVLSTRVEWQEPFRLWADKWTSVFYSVGVDVCWDNSWSPLIRFNQPRMSSVFH